MFVCSDLLIGGTESQLVELACTLSRRGWPVSVYSTAGSGPLRAALERAGVAVILPPLNRPPVGTSSFKRVLAVVAAVPHLLVTMLQRRPAIVHFMLPEAYLLGAPLAKAARIPHKIMSRRSLNLYQGNWFVKTMERRLHRSMDAVLGNSRSVIQQLKDEEDVPPGRLGLIYNGIKPEAFADSETRTWVRNSLGIEKDTLVFCMVANLISYKGHADLIDALAIAAKQMSADWRLLLAGRDDGIGVNLKNKTTQLGLGGHVLFLGPRGDVPALLTASDFGILCSHQESFANAILEGMAAGLPMIVTDVGGNSEAVVDGVTGIIVPSKNPKRLAEAIVRLAHEPAMRRSYGAAGRRRVLERFAMERCVALHDLLYRKLLVGDLPGQIPELQIP
jgi:glycosyltransferase involved in cell wall biosynthesis